MANNDYNEKEQKNRVSRRTILNSTMALAGTTVGMSSSGRASAANEFAIEELVGSEATEKINQARDSDEFEKLSEHATENFELEIVNEKAIEIIEGQDRSYVVVFYLESVSSTESKDEKYNITINISDDRVENGSFILENKQDGMLKSEIISPSDSGFETTEVSSSEDSLQPNQISCGTCETVARVTCTFGCNTSGTVICVATPVSTDACLTLVDQICNTGPGCDLGARAICESLGYC